MKKKVFILIVGCLCLMPITKYLFSQVDWDLVLRDIVVGGSETKEYTGANTITAAGDGSTFVIEDGATVNMEAKTRITLKVGFNALDGSIFTGKINTASVLPSDGTGGTSGPYVLTQIGNNSVQCPRPMSIGFYDDETERTYVVFPGTRMNPLIKYYDHGLNLWSQTVQVGNLGANIDNGELKHAYHDYPVVVKADDGHLLVFYCDHSGGLYMSRSPSPNSIEGDWGDGVHIEVDWGTNLEKPGYPSVFKMENGDLYLFCRGYYDENEDGDETTSYRPWGYLKSTENGVPGTWSDFTEIIKSTPNHLDYAGDLAHMNEIYMEGITYEKAHGTIDERLLMVWHLAGGNDPDNTPPTGNHNHFRKNVYFAYFYPGTTPICKNVKEESLGSMITNHSNEMANNCLVFDTGTPNCSTHLERIKAHYQDDGKPIVVFEFKDDESSDDLSVSYKWNGVYWAESYDFKYDLSGPSKLTGASLADLEKTGSSSFVSYWLKGGDLIAYSTDDGGTYWNEESNQKIDDPIKFHNAHLIDNYQPELKFLITTLNSKVYEPDGTDNDHGYSGEYTTYVAGDVSLPGIKAGHWSFDRHMRDISLNDLVANDGTGSLGYNENGKLGMCAEFNGSSSLVTIPHDPVELHPLTNITVSCWFNPSSLALSNAFLVEKEGTTPRNHGYSLRINGSNVIFRINHTNEISLPFSNANQWYFVAATFSKNLLQLYLYDDDSGSNLVYKTASVTTDSITSSGSNGLVIEKDILMGQGFQGYLDDVRIYYKALSLEELYELIPTVKYKNIQQLAVNSGSYDDLTTFYGLDPGGVDFDGEIFENNVQINHMIKGDFNGDGIDDIAVNSGNSDYLKVFNGTSPPYTLYTGDMFSSSEQIKHMVSGDFDGDGKDEIAVNYGAGDDLKVFDVDASLTSLYLGDMLSSSEQIKHMVSGDFDGDSKDEIAINYGAGDDLKVFDVDASLTSVYEGNIFTTSNDPPINHMISGNFDTDAEDEIAVNSDTYDYLKVFNVEATSLPAIYTGDIFSSASVVINHMIKGNFDDDAVDEIAVNNGYRDAIKVFNANDPAGGCIFQDYIFSTAQDINHMVAVNADGEGTDEIAINSGSYDYVKVFNPSNGSSDGLFEGELFSGDIVINHLVSGNFNNGISLLKGMQNEDIQIVKLPQEFDLKQNYPNPFNPTTTIMYELPESRHVKLEVYNMMGQKVRTLVNQEKEAGYWQVVWDCRDDQARQLPSGVYVYHIQAGEFNMSRKLLFLK